jgi:nitroreductase
MASNPVLDTIRSRRSVLRFENKPVRDDELEAILEAARWAPSWLNSQPWSFIVIKDQSIKEGLSEVVPTAFALGLKEAPICIAVAVNPEEDQYHFVEAGAAASQNMALAVHSLGLQSGWIGVFDMKNQKNSAESRVRQILEIPRTHRVISIIPIGHVKNEIPKKQRKALHQLVYLDKFGKRQT